jgi:hypothetical protein
MKTIKLIQAGDYFSIKSGEEVHIELMTGGNVRAFNNSTVTITEQSGGMVRAWDDSTVNIDTVTGGEVSAFENSKVKIINDLRN